MGVQIFRYSMLGSVAIDPGDMRGGNSCRIKAIDGWETEPHGSDTSRGINGIFRIHSILRLYT